MLLRQHQRHRRPRTNVRRVLGIQGLRDEGDKLDGTVRELALIKVNPGRGANWPGFSASVTNVLPLHLTPAPSPVPQLSVVLWGQSISLSSLPVHATSSIEKTLSTLPQ